MSVVLSTSESLVVGSAQEGGIGKSVGPKQKPISQENVSREQSRNVGQVKLELALSTSEQLYLAASQSDLHGRSRETLLSLSEVKQKGR